MSDWLDRVAADLLLVDADIRAALQDLARGRPDPRRFVHPDLLHLRVRVHEARTLLRGAMPVPIGLSPLRHQHARMLTALTQFALNLLALNEPWPATHDRPADAALAAGNSLLAELREWLRQASWRRAARAARVRWPCPRLSPTTLTELQPQEHLPNAAAGLLHHPAAPLRLVRQLAARQLTLDLAPPPPPELLDLRQLRLQLHAA